MTQEDKDLLFKDLCGRLPYGVKLLHIPTNEITNLEMIGNGVIDGDIHDLIEHFKPYLFPLSSMTEEQKEEYYDLCDSTLTEWGNLIWFDSVGNIDCLYKNHIDVRDLIPMGLAIDATGLNIY